MDLPGWFEGRGDGCYFTEPYVVSRMVAGFSYRSETTATNLAQSMLHFPRHKNIVDVAS